MREIKLRAWDMRLGQMLYPTTQNKFIGSEMEFYPIVFKVHGITHGDGVDLILMQFTGLKDKNGKDIYEGDALVTPGGQRLIVEIDYAILGDPKLWSINPAQCTVIGNVYENPEYVDRIPQN